MPCTNKPPRVSLIVFFALLLSTALAIRFTKQGFHPAPHAWDSQAITAIKPFCWKALRPLSAYQLWLQTRALRNSQGCSQLHFMNPLSHICLSFQHCTLLQLCLEQTPCLQLNAVRSCNILTSCLLNTQLSQCLQYYKNTGSCHPNLHFIADVRQQNSGNPFISPLHNTDSFAKHLYFSWLHHFTGFLPPLTRTSMLSLVGKSLWEFKWKFLGELCNTHETQFPITLTTFFIIAWNNLKLIWSVWSHVNPGHGQGAFLHWFLYEAMAWNC